MEKPTGDSLFSLPFSYFFLRKTVFSGCSNIFIECFNNPTLCCSDFMFLPPQFGGGGVCKPFSWWRVYAHVPLYFVLVYVHPSVPFPRLPLPQHSTHFCFLTTGTPVPTVSFLRICSQHYRAGPPSLHPVSTDFLLTSGLGGGLWKLKNEVRIKDKGVLPYKGIQKHFSTPHLISPGT